MKKKTTPKDKEIAKLKVYRLLDIPKKNHLTQDNLNNALIIACERGEQKFLSTLISLGANPKTCGNQALIWACFSKKFGIVEELAYHYTTKEIKDLIKQRLKTIPKEIDLIIKKLQLREIKTKISKNFQNFKDLNL
jgi:ankyrin repeat protein